jgi:hypothetical protein
MDAGGGWVRGVIRGGRGRFTDLAEFRRVGLAPAQALSVQLAATTLALMVATANVARAIQELGVDVATIRSIAEGKQPGDVAGLYRRAMDTEVNGEHRYVEQNKPLLSLPPLHGRTRPAQTR